MGKLDTAQKYSILGSQNLGSRGSRPPGLPRSVPGRGGSILTLVNPPLTNFHTKQLCNKFQAPFYNIQFSILTIRGRSNVIYLYTNNCC